MPTGTSAASIIVPTFREAANLEPLIERLFAATSAADLEAEFIIVDDDSQDGTEALVASLRNRYPVRLIVRKGERGLSGAVLTGFREAQHDLLLVLDADLQHPPEMVPAMLRQLDEDECDFVIGTRYGGRGGIADDWPVSRLIGSRLATLLARPLARLSDPLSGFFALRRATWQRAEALDPIGYKIALELFVKCRCNRPAEVPIQFGARVAGESKMGAGELIRYLRHLGRLYRFRFPWLLPVALGVLVVIAAVVAWVLVNSGD